MTTVLKNLDTPAMGSTVSEQAGPKIPTIELNEETLSLLGPTLLV